VRGKEAEVVGIRKSIRITLAKYLSVRGWQEKQAASKEKALIIRGNYNTGEEK